MHHVICFLYGKILLPVFYISISNWLSGKVHGTYEFINGCWKFYAIKDKKNCIKSSLTHKCRNQALRLVKFFWNGYFKADEYEKAESPIYNDTKIFNDGLKRWNIQFKHINFHGPSMVIPSVKFSRLFLLF